jgi:LuxR family maltose regulon positive regulatory protein
MEHSLEADDVAEAVRLVEAHRHAAMNQERWLDLQRWLSRLPRQTIDAHLGLVLAEAWLLQHQAALPALPERLACAEALMQQMPLGEETRLGLQGEIDALTSQLVYWTVDTERTLTLAQRALAETPIEHSYVRGIAWMFFGGALALRGDLGDAITALHEGLREDRFHSNTYAPRLLLALCLIYWMVADLRELLRTADHLLELARERDLPESIEWAYYFRGCAHYQRNSVADAQSDFAAVVAEHRIAHGIVFPHSAFGLAAAHQAQGLVEPASAAAATVVKYALEMNNLSMLADARAFEAHLALLQGREGEASHWAAQADRNIRTAPMPLFYVSNFTLVEILLAQGTPATLEEAARLLARLHEVVEATHNTRFQIEALALQALLHDARHERIAALDALAQAVALAEPCGVMRVFADLGPRMAALLYQLGARGAHTEFIARLLDVFPAVRGPAPAPRQPGLIEPLSERELDVLALLAQRLSCKEIARVLSISPMTVKRHSSNIYQKLLVGGRREAVVKAAALGLVSAGPYPHVPMPPENGV